ncbi:MAG: flavin reductase, partial [Bacteroidota bacterium]
GLFNSVVHIGAAPACLGFIMRTLTVNRHTYNNLKATGHFTVNQVHKAIYEQAHQASAKYDSGSSEFDAVGLLPQHTGLIKAPYVKEAHIKIGLEFYEEHYIQINHSWLIVGRILEVLLPENSIGPEGHVDTAAWDGIGVTGLDTYYDLELKDRLPYARP